MTTKNNQENQKMEDKKEEREEGRGEVEEVEREGVGRGGEE